MKTTTTPPLFFLLAVTWFAPPVAAETAYPVEWIRQIGTVNNDRSRSVAVDGTGNVYISGYTEGSLEGTNAGRGDAFLTKFDSDGTELWTQQIGTSSYDYSHSVAVDAGGNAYISGYTSASGGASIVGADAFLTKFAPGGTELWTRQIGTNHHDHSYSVAVDGWGNAYISGHTRGNLGGTNAGEWDAFLTKFNPTGTKLWTQQIGTSGTDNSLSIAVDRLGNSYISGFTSSSLEGTNAGGYDAFLSKFGPTGTEIWTRQIGTDSTDFGYSVAVDGSGNAYISGFAGDNLNGSSADNGGDFLVKFDSTGSELWTRQIGTTGLGSYSAVDGVGNVYISGSTRGNLEGINAGVWDVYLTKFDSTGNELWTQQIGTSRRDISQSVAVNEAGNAYIAGSLEGTNAGSSDAFLIKFTNPIPEPTAGLLVTMATAGLLLRQRQ